MDTSSTRISTSTKPTVHQFTSWMGPRAGDRWRHLQGFIQDNYPGVFAPEWLYGGKKHGWSLRYKKGRSFCTLIPEKGGLAIVIVFGAEERERFADIRTTLSKRTRSEYDAAKTYHDGKWLRLQVSDDQTLKDVERLLAIKRKPKPKGTA